MEERRGDEAEDERFGGPHLGGSVVKFREALHAVSWLRTVSWSRAHALEQTAWVPVPAAQLKSRVAVGKLLNH